MLLDIFLFLLRDITFLYEEPRMFPGFWSNKTIIIHTYDISPLGHLLFLKFYTVGVAEYTNVIWG